VKHFKSEAKLMLLIPAILLAIGIIGALLLPQLLA
jgi:hypothetical protein